MKPIAVGKVKWRYHVAPLVKLISCVSSAKTDTTMKILANFISFQGLTAYST